MAKENYETRGRIHTELGAWMSAATTPMQQELARRTGTSVGYLRLLANGWRENPKLRFAIDLIKHSTDLAADAKKKFSAELPVITLEGLASPTRYPSRTNTSNNRKYRCEG